MRIGIDARALSGRMTGDRTYWRGLISGLAGVDLENEYILYLKSSLEGEPPVGLGPNFSWQILPKPTNNALWMLTAFPKALKRDRIDLAHTQYNIPLLGAPCPVVTTIHDITFRLFPELFLPRDRWILNTFIPPSLQRAAHVIADSESTRRDILRSYPARISAEKVTSILLAADNQFHEMTYEKESAYQTVNQKQELEDHPYILAVGVLQPRKNLALLLEAFRIIKQNPCPLPHRLLIAGKRGWNNQALDQHLAGLPPALQKEIVFTGYLPDQDLPELYTGADAFCYPSFYEGFGLPPLEAMSCGCPALCSDTSSLPEVTGEAAILLSPNDPQAWAEALQRVLTDPDLRMHLSIQGRARAARFSWGRTAAETLQIYSDVYANRQRKIL